MTDQASHMRHNEQAVDSTHHANHVVSPKIYITIILILVVLTWATVEVAYINMGGLWNLVVALGLATIKATFVAMWFMHVRYSGRLISLIIVASLMFLLLMISGTLMDYYTRHNVTPTGYLIEPEYDKGTHESVVHGSIGESSGNAPSPSH